MMKLHFTVDTITNPEHSILYNQIAVDIRKPFINTIESISNQHAKSIDWWVSSPASRNTSASPLFHYCCCLALLQKLIRSNEHIAEIITDSRSFKKIIEGYLAGQGIAAKVTLARLSMKQILKEILRPVYTLFGVPLRHLILSLMAKITQHLKKPLPSGQLTLIDTVVMHGYIEKDRNYPGLLDALSLKERECVWFVPLLYGFRPWHFMSVIKQLRRSKRNFILKEDYLNFKDFLFAWGYVLRIRALKTKPCLFQGVDISRLVQEEMKSFNGLGASYTALLNYRFAAKLKDAGVKLRLVIDWFENQNIDRGWNAAFRRYFPKVETIGYQGFIVSPHYLCMYPTKEEKNNKVIPHKVAVIGRELAQSVRRFCSDLDVCIAPAFRFQHVWRKRKYLPAENVFTILVALPIEINEAVYILKRLDSVIKNDINIRLCIKPHPATSEAQIQAAYGIALPAQSKFVSEDFKDCVEKSNLLIVSSASSTCMEALAKGIPVMIFGSRHGLIHNPIPESAIGDIWQSCNSPAEIKRAIQFYRSRSPEKMAEHEEVGKKIRPKYFEPVTRKGVRKFLGVER